MTLLDLQQFLRVHASAAHMYRHRKKKANYYNEELAVVPHLPKTYLEVQQHHKVTSPSMSPRAPPILPHVPYCMCLLSATRPPQENNQKKTPASPKSKDKETAAVVQAETAGMSRAKGPKTGPGSRGGKGGKGAKVGAGAKGDADKHDQAKPKKARSAYNFYLLKRIAHVCRRR